MESLLMVAGAGPWKNFEEIEESLILDELLLLHESLGRSKHNDYRMLASFQGVDIGEYEGGEDDGEELPEEILVMERERKKMLAEREAQPGDTMPSLFNGLGYQTV